MARARGTVVASFGERLKREREKRKVSLDEIALSTKIGTRMLHALEEEKFEQLPGGIFNKGFVRAYARHLGLDEEQTIADYLEAAGETAPTRLEVTSEVRILPAREADSEKPTRTVPWGMLAAGLLIFALVLSVWSYFRREQREASAPEPVRAAAAPSSNDNGQSAATSQSPPGQNPPAQHPPSAILDAKPINADAPAAAGAFSVTIKANDDSWVAIAADGKTVAADSLLSGGTTRTIQASREIVIKAGNVGALEISFNGKKLQRQGQDGQVKTLTFGTEGLVAPRLRRNQ